MFRHGCYAFTSVILQLKYQHYRKGYVPFVRCKLKWGLKFLLVMEGGRKCYIVNAVLHYYHIVILLPGRHGGNSKAHWNTTYGYDGVRVNEPLADN